MVPVRSIQLKKSSITCALWMHSNHEPIYGVMDPFGKEAPGGDVARQCREPTTDFGLVGPDRASLGAGRPRALGREISSDVRFVVLPPLAILFRIIEDDRQVRVIHVQFWDD